MFALLEQQHSTDLHKEILMNKIYLKYTPDIGKKLEGTQVSSNPFQFTPDSTFGEMLPS